VKRRHLDALATLGIEKTEYRLTAADMGEDGDDLPVICGITLAHPKLTLHIEQVPRGWGGDGKFRLKVGRGWAEELGTYRRQQDAVAEYARRLAPRL
jgi:hypothetical protein